MLDALVAGERDPVVLAGLARGVLRNKTDDLRLEGDAGCTAAGERSRRRMAHERNDGTGGGTPTKDR
jgi:hypothetical protein